MQGKELFEKHLSEWLSAQKLQSEGDPLELVVSVAQNQILHDVRSGIVPATVGSFAELHDFVDANYYGNSFDWPVLPSDTEDDAYLCAFASFWNAVQDRLNEWISSGEMRISLTAGAGA